MTGVLYEHEIEFPNLFGGTVISLTRGFQIFGISIYWYGVIIAVGVILAFIYAMKRCKEVGLVADRVFDVVFMGIIGGFVGARAYYCIFHNLNPASEFKYTFITAFTSIRDGGLAIYGGVIGALIVGFIFAKVRKVNWFTLLDLAGLGLLIGQCIGRWGNFVNQEAYGAATAGDLPWGMTGSYISLFTTEGQLVHPCFLYESLWCLVGFIGLHFYSKKLKTYDGEIFLLYIAWYGLGRAWIEGLRTDSLMAGDIKISQLVAALSVVLGLAAFIIFKIKTEKNPDYKLYANTEQSAALLAEAEEKDNEYKRKKAEKKAAREGVAESILAPDNDNDGDTSNNTDDNNSDKSAEENSSDDNTDENFKINSSDSSGDTAENAEATASEDITDVIAGNSDDGSSIK